MTIPLPTNIIPYWFFPWNTDSWPNYSAFIFHKEIFVIDAIRQIFPWKVFSYSLLKLGIWPLWNPYNFAGQPLLANFQSSVFNPLSWFFLFLPPILAWSIYILIQPILLTIFSFLFFRKIFKKNIPSVLGTVGIIFTAFFSTHYFWGVVICPLIWLPLSLYLTEVFKEKRLKPLSFISLQTIIFSMMILGGYPQTSVFSLGLATIYFLFRCQKNGLRNYIFALLLALGVCSVQLLPTYELYKLSPREGNDSVEIVKNSFVRGKDLIMTISPDFFGSPATNNYSGGSDYSGVNGYFGIVLLPLSLFALRNFRKSKEIHFWSVVSAFGLLMALENPISHLPSLLGIPILGSGAPWYYLFFFQLGMIVLAGYGWLDLSTKTKREKLFITILSVVAIIISVLLIIGHSSAVATNSTLKIILPFGAFFITYLISPKKAGLIAVLVTIIFGVLFWQRISPFGETRYFYPPHPLVSFLQKNASIDRFWGPDNAHIPSELGAYYGIAQLEGYDSLWPKQYGELVAGAIDGQLHQNINRAEVIVTQDDNENRKRLFNLLGVKYFLDKSDNPVGDSGHNVTKFPQNKFKLIKQWKVASVYENKESFPRSFLVDNYIVAKGADELKKVFDPKVDIRNTAILEKNINIKNLTGGATRIISYKTNEVDIETISKGKSLLVLSDNYFPGWRVYVNGKRSELLRADYSLRAVIVPPGVSEVSFKYEPEPFDIGLKISAVAIGLLCLISLLSLRKNGFHWQLL